MKFKNKAVLVILALSALLCSCTGNSEQNTGENTENTNGSVQTVPAIQTPDEDTDHTLSDTSDSSSDTTDTSGNTTGTETSADTTDTVTSDAPASKVEYTYSTDVSKYLEYIDPKDRDGYLVLVNRNNPLDEDYVPEDLTDLADTRDDGRATQQMVEAAAMSLEALLIEARDAGCKNIAVTSGYRSYSRQDYLFNIYTSEAMDPDEMSKNFKTEESLDTLVKNLVSCLDLKESLAQSIADKIADKEKLTKEEALYVTRIESCVAGTSEHQSGLCVDMHNLSSAKPEFAETFEAQWLAENCHKFGFVVRFPENKTNVTKIVYEPWHFRFVGRYHAQRMKDLDMCLEEYVEYLENE